MPVIQMRTRKPIPRPSVKRKATRVYAIAFDFDTAVLERLCGSNYPACYRKFGAVLAGFGFGRPARKRLLYLGNQDSDAVHCVMAVQEADRRFAWFAPAVRDLRMLRVDEDNDLMPAINNRLRFGDNGESIA